jgi:hypothetical protein
MRTPRPSTVPSPPRPVARGVASHTRRRLDFRPALLLGLVTALLAPPPPAQAARPARYGWPLAAPHPVVRAFSAPATPYGSGHRGVDLGGTAGEPVLAAGDGTVVFAGQVFDRPVVSIDHQGGLRTTYEPVDPMVRIGSRVRRGEQIGTLRAGHAGCPAAACLHWGARRGRQYLNPLRLVTPGRVRLLPLPPPTQTRSTQDPRSLWSARTRAEQLAAAGNTRRPNQAGSLRQPPRSAHRPQSMPTSTRAPPQRAYPRPHQPWPCWPDQATRARPQQLLAWAAQPQAAALDHRRRTTQALSDLPTASLRGSPIRPSAVTDPAR